VRTARVTFESRTIWDIYHSEGIRRDVNWKMLRERTEAQDARGTREGTGAGRDAAEPDPGQA